MDETPRCFEFTVQGVLRDEPMVSVPKPSVPVPPTEVSTKARRRRFTAEYKRRILSAVLGCSQPGEVGALLRREGLYSSHLTEWRRAAALGELDGPKKRGTKAHVPDARDRTITTLEGELRREKARADRAEALVALQKKVAELLGLVTASPSET